MNEIVSMVAKAEKESAKKIYATLWHVSVPERGQGVVEKLEEGEEEWQKVEDCCTPYLWARSDLINNIGLKSRSVRSNNVWRL